MIFASCELGNGLHEMEQGEDDTVQHCVFPHMAWLALSTTEGRSYIPAAGEKWGNSIHSLKAQSCQEQNPLMAAATNAVAEVILLLIIITVASRSPR